MKLLNKRSVGWIVYDFANSAFATIVLAVIFNQYFSEVIAGGSEGVVLTTFLGDIRFEGAVLWNYLVAFSTAVVAISSPILGAMSDQASIRKRMLVIYCYLGVAATIALSIVNEGDILLASLLFLAANLGFAGGNVFYNAFLVDIGDSDSYGRLSGVSWGLGYLGGGLCLALNLALLIKPELFGIEKGGFTVSHCMIIAGLWWGVFALPTVFWLKDKPRTRERLSLVKLTKIGWNRISTTIRDIRKYRQLVRFLISYLIFNDGVETVIIMASIFGANVIGLEAVELIGFFIMIQFTGLIGSFGFGWLSDRIGNKNTLFITLAIWLTIICWAYFIGWLIDPRIDFFIIGLIAGLAMGGSQTVARAMQAKFTPPGKSAEFFGFFAVSGRFASIFGPLIYGTAVLITGGVQSGILSLGLFFLAGGAVLWTVDEKSGEQASRVY